MALCVSDGKDKAAAGSTLSRLSFWYRRWLMVASTESTKRIGTDFMSGSAIFKAPLSPGSLDDHPPDLHRFAKPEPLTSGDHALQCGQEPIYVGTRNFLVRYIDLELGVSKLRALGREVNCCDSAL